MALDHPDRNVSSNLQKCFTIDAIKTIQCLHDQHVNTHFLDLFNASLFWYQFLDGSRQTRHSVITLYPFFSYVIVKALLGLFSVKLVHLVSTSLSVAYIMMCKSYIPSCYIDVLSLHPTFPSPTPKSFFTQRGWSHN